LPPTATIRAGSADRPAYANTFRCIGSECEDTCCQGWNVPVDLAAWEKYQSLPQSPLRVLIDSCIAPAEESAKAAAGSEGAIPQSSPAVFAMIRMNSENQCPLLSADRLCRIQSEIGESFLSYTCATYPRILTTTDGVAETALALSCPEAARLVLLTPNLLSLGRTNTDSAAQACESATDLRDGGESDDADLPIQTWFLPIRQSALALVQNRLYPLWQRLFLLDMLCRRLDSIASGELKRSVPAFLAGFDEAVTSGELRPAMEKLPADRTAQLDIVLRLAGLMLHKSNVRPRFVECVHAFTAGIGNGPGATLESLTAHYVFAHDRHFAPFFSRHPHILENFLINAIIRRQFPFGREGLQAGSAVNMTREFALLSAQFVLMRGLLIGVAGRHGASFSTAHVVHTVQAASKHFEHHPEFLDMAHALLVERGMDGARGMAILLRSVAPEAGGAGPIPASPGISVPAGEGEISVSASAAAPRPAQAAQGKVLPE